MSGNRPSLSGPAFAIATAIAAGSWAVAPSSYGAPVPGTGAPPRRVLAEKLEETRKRILNVESALLKALAGETQARGQIARIKSLIALQRQERDLGRKRLLELEALVADLVGRRQALSEKIARERVQVRSLLKDWQRSTREPVRELALGPAEELESPKRKVVSRLVARGLRQIELLRADLGDAQQLEDQISQERQQLTYLTHDLMEQESVLELNRKLQADVLQESHAKRVEQLQAFQRLKQSEHQIEALLGDLSARRELERAEENERQAYQAMRKGAFENLRGHLRMPVAGRISGEFGRVFDPSSGLQIFKKGIEISAGKKLPVRAVSAGKVIYSGELSNFGQVVLLDHGNHYYSLCGHLGALARKVGDAVVEGDELGQTDDAGTPVYFEIRSRNVAVNPLQWLHP